MLVPMEAQGRQTTAAQKEENRQRERYRAEQCEGKARESLIKQNHMNRKNCFWMLKIGSAALIASCALRNYCRQDTGIHPREASLSFMGANYILWVEKLVVFLRFFIQRYAKGIVGMEI